MESEICYTSPCADSVHPIIPLVAIAADPCAEWFAKARLKAGPDCTLRCAALPTGMDTFTCPQECENLCGKILKPDSKWRKKLKDGRPKKWHTKYERTRKWTQEEIDRVTKVMESLPKELTDRLGDIYRLDESMIGSPGEAEDNDVVLYDSAFGKEYNLDAVVGHELAHMLYKDLSDGDRRSYLDAAQWRRDQGRQSVGRAKGTFVREHGRDSPNEDFSINVESYLYDPARLKQMTPKVYNWIDEHYGPWLKVGK